MYYKMITLDGYLKGERYGTDLDNKILHIVNSVKKAEGGLSKITGNDGILNYKGMTGIYTRHFYNNLCSDERIFDDDIRYLEIGTWNGSSSISTMYKNKVKGTFIDNWSEFGGDSANFTSNLEKYTGTKNYKFIENDCWTLDTKKIGKYNVYLYDGGHTEDDHYKSLVYYYDNLEDTFIFMVDDWDWKDVRDGTFRAIKDLGLDIKFKHEIILDDSELLNMPEHTGKNTWWNGIGIFILSKKYSINIKGCI